MNIDDTRTRQPRAVILANVLTVIGIVMALVLFLGLLLSNLGLQSQLRASTANAQELYGQLLDEGISPDAERPTDVVKDASPGVPGSTGPRGATGSTGDDGPPGRPGTDGSPGSPGTPGAAGEAGTDGTDGVGGADGPSGPPGAAGADGASGAPGSTGAAGSDGQPPLGWIYTDPVGVLYTCTRTDPFDPAAPNYQCTGGTP